jgi:hypothetical protein
MNKETQEKEASKTKSSEETKIEAADISVETNENAETNPNVETETKKKEKIKEPVAEVKVETDFAAEIQSLRKEIEVLKAAKVEASEQPRITTKPRKLVAAVTGSNDGLRSLRDQNKK